MTNKNKIILEWSIVNLERDANSDVITTAHWNLNGTDGEFSANVYGSCNVSNDENSNNFIPFEDVKKDDVISWVKSSLGKDQVLEYEQNVCNQIEKKKNPKTKSGLPW